MNEERDMDLQHSSGKGNGHTTRVPTETETPIPRPPRPLPQPSLGVSRKRWWRMSELSEKTRIGLQIGTAVIVIAAVFAAGQYIGGWQSERVNTVKTLDRHDVEIRQLREAVTAMDRTLLEIKTTQNASVESINTSVRQTTFLITEMTSIRAALQERGIRLPRNDDP